MTKWSYRGAPRNRLAAVGILPSLRASGRTRVEEQSYAYKPLTVGEAVEHAVNGTWSLPSFQRRFIWTPNCVLDLAESLWRDYPIGSLLIWERARDGAAGKGTVSLIVDGQHRLTSLCILFGEKPLWWSGRKPEEWDKIVRRCEVWFDLEADRPPFFRNSTDAMVVRGDPRLVPISKYLSLDPKVGAGQEELRRAGSGPEHATTRARYERLLSVRTMREKTLMAIFVRHDQINDVLEIFSRLNHQGIRFRRLLLTTILKATRGLWAAGIHRANEISAK